MKFDLKKLFSFVKSNTQETSSLKIDNENIICFELNPKYVAYKIKDNSINYIGIDTPKNSSWNEQLQVWKAAVDSIVLSSNIENIDEYLFTFMYQCECFYIKHTQNHVTLENAKQELASKFSHANGSFQIAHIDDKSYLAVEDSHIKEFLLLFKEYNIADIYDASLLCALYMQQEKHILLLNLSLSYMDVIFHHNHWQKRVAPSKLSFDTFIQECADEMYIDFSTSYTNIQNNFKDVMHYKELESSSKMLFKKFKKFIDELSEYIEASLSYFAITEDIDYINCVYVNGDGNDFDVVIRMLQTKLELDFVTLNHKLRINSTEKINLTLYSQIDENILDKLHLSFDGMEFVRGNEDYVFIENKFISKGFLTSEQKEHLEGLEHKSLDTTIDNLLLESKKDIPWYKQDVKILVLYFISFLKGERKKELKSKNKAKINIRFVVNIVLILLFILILWIGFQFIIKEEHKFNTEVSTLEDRIKRVDTLKSVLAKTNKEINFEEIKDVDKIFWTQKIITLADLMPNEIWLSAIYMQNDAKNIEGKAVVGETLVLEARALPSSMGHISNIAKYMENLLRTDDDFKKDFSSIDFGGATIIDENGYKVVNFKLFCHFQKNIHLKKIEQKKINKENIIENLSNIKQTNSTKMEILDTMTNGAK